MIQPAMVRGDIWLVTLDPTAGSEIRKTRPCLIISPDEMNQHLKTVLVVPLTTGSRPAPYRIDVNFQGKTGRIVADHLRSVDKSRLVKRLGTCPPTALADTLTVLQNLFAE